MGKWKQGRYLCDGTSTSWVKIKNPSYSQMDGRAEFFEQRGGTKLKARNAAPQLVLA